MDYYLSWILGREVYEGSDSKEVMEVVARITDGDPLSWQWEWVAFAPEVIDSLLRFVLDSFQMSLLIDHETILRNLNINSYFPLPWLTY